MHLLVDAFEDVIQYMNPHISTYSIMFEGDETLWVFVYYIKYIFKANKNFRFELARFVKSITKKDYKTEDEDLLLDFGTLFMSWDMAMVLLLQEGVNKDSVKVKEKERLSLILIFTLLHVFLNPF